MSSHYDTAIFQYFNQSAQLPVLKISDTIANVLRYGENPHQRGWFYGNLDEVFDKLNGKELSYNNLLDIDAGIQLLAEFSEPTIAIIKHNNACGLASRKTIVEAWNDALAGDPVSAFGGVILVNRLVDETLAGLINTLFFEVLIAPDFSSEAVQILSAKKNRIVLKQKSFHKKQLHVRSALNGYLVQDFDNITVQTEHLKSVTEAQANEALIEDLLFADKIVKHTKSNTIVLAKNKQLLGSGTGQTSRVDALKHAIIKAKAFGFDLNNAVMASDAFFPFPDCVEIAHQEGIKTVIQPGGSVKDNDSIAYCNQNDMVMYFSGFRHFKH